MLDADPREWDATFRALASEWAGLQHARETIDIEAWDRSMATLRAEHQRLVDEGLWVSGPSDLMTIVGRHRDELAHSNVIAWLLTPTGRHGLGTRLLKALFQAGWTDKPVPACTLVTIEREVALGERRADVIARVDDVTLVIENKVDAMESVGQCEELFALWSPLGGDVRFLLLSPTGRAPASTRSREAGDAWRSMSYRALLALLGTTAGSLAVDAKESRALDEYLVTLGRMYPGLNSFSIAIGGGHVEPR